MSAREQAALKTVKSNMWWSMGAGLIPVHYVDLAAVAAVQLRMLAEISKLYDVPFQENRGKAAIAALGGFVLPHSFAFGAVGSLLKHVPLLGPLAGAPAMVVFCAAYTWGLGNLFIQHFEAGGTLLNLNPDDVKAHFKAHFDSGQMPA